MNNLETPPSPDDSKERRLEFINALQEELLSLVKDEEISVGEALGVMRRGTAVEVGFSEDPKRDAAEFARAGAEGRERPESEGAADAEGNA